MISLLPFLGLACTAYADLRFASRPRESYKLRNENGAIPFVEQNIITTYMDPSTFEYDGLAGKNGQKKKNYDQFLRSNIDNEQDNRNFNNNDGKDHLPFRTYETTIQSQESQVDTTVTMAAGESKMIPFRWNNPHASELEVNIWIFRQEKAPIVVPIRHPTCSGEGHQDNIVSFTVPVDFLQLPLKISDFTGCKAPPDPNCVLQVYAHSVESRTYAYGVPIEITGAYSPNTVNADTLIKQPPQDPGMDLSGLRELCLPSGDASSNIATAEPQWAILYSDVYSHSYQNSDFSAYSGQQHDKISRNLQAAAVNKMVTGNRGELGKAALPQATKNEINRLAKLENTVYKRYESYANNLIKQLENRPGMQEVNGQVTAGGAVQQLADCFRCTTGGSTRAKRQETNTYIPSYKLPQALIAEAKSKVKEQYRSLITDDGTVQIYVAAMNQLMPEFVKAAEDFGILYQPAMRKTTFTAMPDATQFKKRDANGKIDNGKYAATVAKVAFAASKGCAENCLKCPAGGDNKAPLLNGKEYTGTCVTGSCANCASLFKNFENVQATPPPTGVSVDLDNLPDIDVPSVEDYPDADGSPREGRPADSTTTTRKVYYAPPGQAGGWMGGSTGVVSASVRSYYAQMLGIGVLGCLMMM